MLAGTRPPLAMGQIEDQSVDVLVLVAFTSDAIPTYLVTPEAYALYLPKVTDAGAPIAHIWYVTTLSGYERGPVGNLTVAGVGTPDDPSRGTKQSGVTTMSHVNWIHEKEGAPRLIEDVSALLFGNSAGLAADLINVLFTTLTVVMVVSLLNM